MNSSDGLIETVTQFNRLDYAIIISLLVISLVIGIFIAFYNDGGKTMDDFLFGGFNMKSIPVALSLLAR